MKNLLVTLSICLFCIFTANGQTKHESVLQLISLMQQDQMVDKIFDGMTSAISSQMQSGTKTPEEQLKAKASMDSMFVKIKSITKRLINEDMVPLYEKYYTQEDINNYIKFYKTPSGKKLIITMPDMQKDLMNIMMTKYVPEIKASFELKKGATENK